MAIAENIRIGEISQSLSQSIKELAPSSIILIQDENTAEHCLPLIQSVLPSDTTMITVASGEKSKNIDSCQNIWAQMLFRQTDRNALVINLGGGMVTDLGGFIAGTYKRGIDFINVPTSLLAMVDASVGSKTGINLEVKNSIGLFADAHAVLIDSKFLETLPPRELVSGFAEILKHGLICDRAYWSKVSSTHPRDIENWDAIIRKSVEIKSDVVHSDPFESGRRKILNFGHTVGHALESVSMNGGNSLLHGEAILLGILAELRISQEKLSFPEQEFMDVHAAITPLIQGLLPLRDMTEDELLSVMANDKKNENSTVKAALLSSIGNCEHDVVVSKIELQRSLQFLFSL